MSAVVFLSLVGCTLAGQMSLCEYFAKLGIHRPECGDSQPNKAIVSHIPTFNKPIITPPPTFFTPSNSFNSFNSFNNNNNNNGFNNGFNNNNFNPFNNFNNMNNNNFNNFNSFSQAPVFSQLMANSDGNIMATSIAPTLGQNLPLCRNYFHSCMASPLCESGQVCSNGLGHGSCCTNPSRAACPVSTLMHINCRKTRAVNWCNTDAECRGHSTTASLCCPTGCNYNMCVHVGPQITMERGNMVFSSLMGEQQCPDPYQLNVKCIVGKPTNHCYTNADCLSGIYPRKCCRTLCNYNVCAMNLNGKWIVA